MSAPVCCAAVAAGPLDETATLEVALRLEALELCVVLDPNCCTT